MTDMQFQELVSQLREMQLPNKSYVIISSGSLAARGIREANDFDILVLPEVFKELAEKYEVSTKNNMQVIKYKDLELMSEGTMFAAESPTGIQDQIQIADIIDGIPFQNLQELKKFKQKLGREKDYNDIRLIDDYLMSH